MEELIKEVLAWWGQHQFDSYSDSEGEEYNVYDDPPKFVQIAQELKRKSEEGGK